VGPQFFHGDALSNRSAIGRECFIDLACAAPRLDCVESSTGQPSAMFGHVWVEVAANNDYFVTLNPSTLLTYNGSDIGNVNDVSVEAFDSAWTYDVDYGEVQRRNPAAPDPAAVIPVTDPPHLDGLDGSCPTSIAAAGDAVWVTLAPSVIDACNP
jgi:hypothetical protein